MISENTKRALIFAGGVAAGGTAAYFVVNAKLNKHYQTILDEEVEQLKEYYKLVRKEDYQSPVVDEVPYEEVSDATQYGEDVIADEVELDMDDFEALQAAQKALSETAYKNAKKEGKKERIDYSKIKKQDAVTAINNVFENAEVVEEEDDVEAEEVEFVSVPSTTEPFVISYEEFLDDDPDHDKITITYFDGDGILVDERESLINDTNYVVGKDALGMFGQGSHNADTVYVRNPVTKTDFEVVRDMRSYTEVVAGVTKWDNLKVEEPRHRPKKLRDDI